MSDLEHVLEWHGRAQRAQQAVDELIARTTDAGDRQTADEGVPAGSAGVETGDVSAGAPNSPSAEGPAGDAATASAGPYTFAELEALFTSVWSLDDDGTDLTRFHDLLHAALAFIARVASGPIGGQWDWHAAELLRSMEQRALWGPDHPVEQP